ncbi:LuxR C-terminal-related transcriptional regulator [Paenibacillus thiaminolyticus]|uniref:LuxR C-terminal-related transcriptional regulator n=1 Tax=Paenibacillus thiaminolyticus TaxID=49283 RepID=UPI002350A958|nr:LuxR C-terminal-related transcriptional regulator [Paenibacillus thiaminolyticus]WCR28602.1 LuxR C-terminal-related transcriptional regulator [Paenibacillus thiaminolyticus]
MDHIRLISAKLMAPIPRKHYIRRERLFTKLRHVQEYKVVVVQGAAGSGKTTLLTSYMKEAGQRHFRWIALDEDNNDLYSFWYYVLGALKEDLGSSAEGLYQVFEAIPHKHDMETILTLIVNQLYQMEALTLVLDDAHVLDKEEVLRSLEFFIKYSPEQVRLVLLSREAPKLYLGEWMMDGKYAEINESELKFSDEEAAQFLQQTLALEVDQDTAGRLNEQTEGWAGGLQLIALAMSSKTEMPSSHNSSGLNKYMVTYLSNEILRSLDGDETRFLLHTSILGYFDEAICNGLLEIRDARMFIDRLQDKNLFLVTIDENAGLYRYHHLFREFLRYRLSTEGEGAIHDLHVKAAAIYEQRGDQAESVKHYIQARRYPEAMDVIARMPQSMQGWVLLRQIPLAWLSENRDLLFQRLFYHFCIQEFEQCRLVLEALQPEHGREGDGSILQFTRFFMDEAGPGLDFEPLPLQEMDPIGFSDATRAIIYITSSMMLGLRDQYAQALDCVEQALALEERNPNPYIRFFALTCKNQLLEAIGEFAACERLYATLFQLIEDHPYLSPAMATNLIGIGGIYMKMMRLDDAEHWFGKVKRQLTASYPSMEMGYAYNRFELALLRGDARVTKERMREMWEEPAFRDHPYYHLSLLRYQLSLGEPDSELLQRFLSRVQGREASGRLRYDERLLYARVLAARGEAEEALKQTDDILMQVRKRKLPLILVDALLHKIMILHQEGSRRKPEILNLIREAVHYSYANEIAYLYLLAGEAAQQALLELLQEKEQDLLAKEKAFIQRVSSFWKRDSGGGDVLSERELEVLQAAASGLRNKEIGELLCISIATVKTHMIHIYSKLQASNRVEAVEKARQLGLLD